MTDMIDMDDEPQEPLWEISARKFKQSLMGRPVTFETPEDLVEACIEYFQWVEKNPLKEAKFYTSDGVPGTHDMAKLRIMSVEALSGHLGIVSRTWRHWKDPKSPHYRADLLPVINWAEERIRNQQLEGASSGLLNANIVSRLLGLVDKKEHAGPDGGPIPVGADMSLLETARRMAYILDKGARELEEGKT